MALDLEQSEKKFPFGATEEQAVISFLIEYPENVITVCDYLSPDLFQNPICKLIIAQILNDYTTHGAVPSRELLCDRIMRVMKVEDPYEEVLTVINKKPNIREVPLIKETLLAWVKKRVYGMLYDPIILRAYESGNYEMMEDVFTKASKVIDISNKGFWLFKQYESLLQETSERHVTTGFPRLDQVINNGGPSPGEVFVWLAATGVGKSILLCNNAVYAFQSRQNVLYVTFELSTVKTAMRIVGSMTKIPLHELAIKKDKVETQLVDQHRRAGSDIVLWELPPGECSVNNIYAIINLLKKQNNWKPDVVIIDYLELMTSRHADYNRDDYTAQKHISTEVRGLARNEDVVVFTATQGNRSSSGNEDIGANIDLNKLAESYGKAMPMDYVVSINQTSFEREANPASFRFYVAKNRNGDKFKTITASVNYSNMFVTELNQ